MTEKTRPRLSFSGEFDMLKVSWVLAKHGVKDKSQCILDILDVRGAEKRFWNLAENGCKCPDCEREGSMKCIELHSFYQFIQYVKEDIKKESDDKISKIRILYLIDKRKGEF